jgi:exopolysaccharide biosynthesis polyprenyl glycosylphosphotransferase
MSAAHAQDFASPRPHNSVPELRPSSFTARSRQASAETLLCAIVDFSVVWLSAALVLGFRMDSGAISAGSSLEKNAGFLVLFSILVVLFCQIQGGYRAKAGRRFDEWIIVLTSVGLATIVLAASIYLSGQHIVSRIALGMTVVTSAMLLLGWRAFRHRRLQKRIAAGHDCRNVLLFGWGEYGTLVEQQFADNRVPGYVVKALVDRRKRSLISQSVEHKETTSKTIEHLDELFDIVRGRFIDEILVALPEDREVVKELIVRSRQMGVDLRVIPDVYDGMALGAAVEHLGPFPSIQIHEKPIPRLGHILKRCIDVLGSSTALLLLFPVCVLIALAVRLTSPGQILYKSARIGKKGRTFTCYKFRTMVENADALKDKLRDSNQRSQILFKIADDPRVTRVGRVLRKYSLDEIPQFWNVLNGDMSLVGPRPPIPGEYVQYELEHLKRLHVPPGITGLWQVEARTDPSFESYINLDSHYVEHWSLWLDFKILFKTLAVVLAGTGQ